MSGFGGISPVVTVFVMSDDSPPLSVTLTEVGDTVASACGNTGNVFRYVTGVSNTRIANIFAEVFKIVIVSSRCENYY